MKILLKNISFAVCLGASLVACASSPHYSGAGHDYDRGRRVSRCDGCGTVQNIERIFVEDKRLGGGTVLGALIGGAVGNQVGSGNGRRAATVAGAAVGGAIGHDVEKRRREQHPAYRIEVRLDTGRWQTFTQRENLGLRSGDRVIVQRGHVNPLY